MRQEFKKILGYELRFLAIETRDKLNLTQKEMGIKLHMSESSYSDLENGRFVCGALTTILLLNMQEDPNAFLKKTNEKFAKWYENEMQEI